MRCWGCSDLNQAALAFKEHSLTGKQANSRVLWENKQTQDSRLRSQNSEARIEESGLGN